MPEADLPGFLALAAGHGCTAVELRTAPGQPVHTGLKAVERADVRRLVAQHGLTVADLSTYVRVCAPGDEAVVVADLVAHLRLAADVGARAVRVFPGGAGDGSDDDRGRRRIAAVEEEVRRLGVEVLVETHDSHRSGAAVADLLAPWAGSTGAVGAVWDVLHSWRAGEPAGSTVEALGPLLRLVQVKDAAGTADTDPLTVPGEGCFPIADVTRALASAGYEGWLSLEWERPWSPDLPDLDTALAATLRWLDQADGAVGGGPS